MRPRSRPLSLVFRFAAGFLGVSCISLVLFFLCKSPSFVLETKRLPMGAILVSGLYMLSAAISGRDGGR